MKFPHVACTHQRRTAIAVGENDGIIQFIPLNYEVGLQINELPTGEYAKAYPTVMADYPIERAAELYAQYSHTVGASDAALDFLGRFVQLSAKDREMATTKKASAAAPAKKTAAGKTAPKAPKAAKSTEQKAPRENPSQMFRDLLVAQAKGENKLTDDQLFAAVQKKYPSVTDDRRAYVSWYRGDCVRKGLITAAEAAAMKGEPAPKAPKAAAAKKAAAKKAAPAAKTAPAKKAAAKKAAKK